MTPRMPSRRVLERVRERVGMFCSFWDALVYEGVPIPLWGGPPENELADWLLLLDGCYGHGDALDCYDPHVADIALSIVLSEQAGRRAKRRGR